MGGRGAGAAKVNETLQSTVFNCALNPALKKKKIPRVIPPLPNQVRCIVKLIYRVAHQVSDYILLTLIWEFHHVAYLACQFCQICSCPSRIRQTS